VAENLYLALVIVSGVVMLAMTVLMIWLLAAYPGRSGLPIIALPLFSILAPVAAYEYGGRAIDRGSPIIVPVAVGVVLLLVAVFEVWMIDRLRNPHMTWQARAYCGLNLACAFVIAHLTISSHLVVREDLIENPPPPSWRSQ